jgi:hypothetical protein
MTAVATPPSESTPRPLVPDDAELPRHRRRTRWIRTVVALAVGVAVALTLPWLVVRAADTIADSTEGTSSVVVTPGGTVEVTLPDTPGALLAVVDDAGEMVGATVVALAPEGRGGHLVLLPAGTRAPVQGVEGDGTRLAEAYARGGLPLLTTTAEGYLGVTFATSAEAGRSDLEALLAPYAPLAVELRDDVLVPGPDGEPVVLLAAGPHELSAAEAADLLLARIPGESEIARLDQTAAVWRALAAGAPTAAPAGATAPQVAAAPGDVPAFLASVLGGPARVHELPVTPVVDLQSNPDGIDLLFVDPPAVRLLMAQVLPGSVSPSNGNIRLRLVNPSGDAALTYAAVARLVYLGANVVIASDELGTVPAETVLEMQDIAEAERAAQYGRYLGGVTTRPSPVEVDGIDATMILGRSFADFVAEEAAKATTTTTSTTVDASATTIEEDG